MKKINKQILIENIRFVLDRIKKLYPIRLNANLHENIKNINIVVDKLDGKLIENRFSEIAVDEQFFNYDGYDNVISVKEDRKQLFILRITHNILHELSRSKNNNGIIDFEHFYYKYLNEGITQAITEEITGSILSVFSDLYNECKKIAKIIKITVGNDILIKSYFDHTNDLKNACNFLAKDNSFFDELNRDIYSTGKLLRKADELNGNLKQSCLNIVHNKYVLIYKKVIVNLVIPKLNQLNDKGKEQYLKQILDALKDDIYIENELINILKTLISSITDLDNVIMQIKQEIYEVNEQAHFLDLSLDINNILNAIILKSNGDIFYKTQNDELKQVTDYNLCRYIYDKTQKIKQTRTITEIDIIKDMIDKGGINISFGKNTILNRRQFIESLRSDLKSVGLYMLDEYGIVDYKPEFMPTFIKMNKVISFKDLNKIANQFLVIFNSESNNFEVFDRIITEKVCDDKLKILASFAYIWTNSVGFNYENNYKMAFDESFKKVYDEITQIMRKGIDNSGNINSKDLENYKINSSYKTSVINKLLKTPLSYRIVYEYLTFFEKSDTVQAEIEKSISEQNNTYDDSNAITSILLKSNKTLKI